MQLSNSWQDSETFFDITIVGAGAIGLAMANFLSELDLRIAIVDSRKHSYEEKNTERSIALSLASINTLAKYKLWDKLSLNANAIENVYVSKQKVFGTCRIRAYEHGVKNLGYVLPISKIEQILYNNIVNNSKITFIEQTKLVQAECHEKNWQLTLEDITLNVIKKIATNFVIAADGTNSFIKKSLAIENIIKGYEQSALITNVQHSLEHANTAYERFITNGAIAMLPFKKYLSTCVITNETETIKSLLELSESDFLLYLQDNFGYRLGSLNSISTRINYPLHRQISSEQVYKRCLIIGNAAQTIHPVAAQGMNLSIRDAHMFSALLQEQMLKESVFTQIDFDKLLKQYVKLRSKDKNTIIGFTDLLVKYCAKNNMPNVVNSLGLQFLNSFSLAKDLIANIGMGTYLMEEV